MLYLAYIKRMDNDTTDTTSPYEVQLNVRISPKLKRDLEKVSALRYTTVSALVREGILGVIRRAVDDATEEWRGNLATNDLKVD